MQETQRRRTGVGTGTVSLLVIFTVLCLATLALLSTSTAASNRRISQRSVQNTIQLANVQGQAAQKLAQLDTALLALPKTEDDAQYYTQALQAAKNLGCEGDAAQNTVWFTLPITETTTLITKVQLLPPGSDTRYQMVEQSSQITGEWSPEQGGILWPG
ncbi:hypothetical protein LJC61_03230 [Ruminococcaceae bacterium OttesenSCG-928-A16]|nr:hypothetical protein [Ruminococcaceae bacterium OttesenSCG-928-A16]